MRHGQTDGSFNVADRLAAGASLSGGERNHFFRNRGGRQFAELSGVCGADHLADGRAFAALDFDRDGWVDLAVVNANEPLFQLFRNRLGETVGRRYLAVRLVGGNHRARPTGQWSARDGFGARLALGLKDRALVRTVGAGAGFSAQNSATALIGLGAFDQVDYLQVDWPSGRVRRSGRLPGGSLVTVYENPAQSPTGRAFVVRPYRPVPAAGTASF